MKLTYSERETEETERGMKRQRRGAKSKGGAQRDKERREKKVKNRRSSKRTRDVQKDIQAFVKSAGCTPEDVTVFSVSGGFQRSQSRRLRFVLVSPPDLKCFMFSHLLLL